MAAVASGCTRLDRLAAQLLAPSKRRFLDSRRAPPPTSSAAAAEGDTDPQSGRGDIVLPSGRLRSEVPLPQHSWHLALQLNAKRQAVGGSAEALATAITRGADMRVATNFPHAEHIDPASGFGDMIGEVAGFPVTYVIQRPAAAGPWVAGVMTQRQPIECPTGFGPRPSMSFFLYNMDGHQAIARPFLDGRSPRGAPSGPETAGVQDSGTRNSLEVSAVVRITESEDS
jgi:hypothetical protein